MVILNSAIVTQQISFKVLVYFIDSTYQTLTKPMYLFPFLLILKDYRPLQSKLEGKNMFLYIA